MSLLVADDSVRASGLSEPEFLLEIVIMLFQKNRISSGKASDLLPIHRLEFQKLLPDRGICLHYDIDEFQQDLETLYEEGY